MPLTEHTKGQQRKSGNFFCHFILELECWVSQFGDCFIVVHSACLAFWWMENLFWESSQVLSLPNPKDCVPPKPLKSLEKSKSFFPFYHHTIPNIHFLSKKSCFQWINFEFLREILLKIGFYQCFMSPILGQKQIFGAKIQICLKVKSCKNRIFRQKIKLLE